MRFKEETRKILSQIPEGRVTTYGEVAKALGDVRASRAVFDLLSRNPQESHRVVNSQGKVRPWQLEPLRKDGVPIEGEFIHDIHRILFRDFQTRRPLKTLAEEQERLAKKVVLEDGFEKTERVCGFDLAYKDDHAICGFAVVDSKNLDVIEKGVIVKEIDFPYIPSYLAYREFPAIRDAYKKVKSDVDILLVDGHGFLHPRRAGIACHVGVMLEKPTIGVAKNLLVGRAEKPPSKSGGFERIQEKGETLGYALRSSSSRKLIYISPGHLVSFESSVHITKKLCKTRIPEPLRLAHIAASKARAQKP